MPVLPATFLFRLFAVPLVLCLAAVVASGWPAEPPADVAARIDKSVALLQSSAAKYTEERSCFSCHHQALPAMTVPLAVLAGRPVDAAAARRQSEFTVRYFAELREEVAQGKGVLGGAYSAGYALTSLSDDNWPPDETTDALVAYLFQRQQEDGRWKIETHRPPLEDSDFTATALSARGIKSYATAERREEAERRIALARDWLTMAEPQTHEAQSFRLLGLHWTEAEPSIIEPAVERLLAAQHDDGGWSQTADLESDAYATGQALVALHQAGGVAIDHAGWQRGISWLLRNQDDDGSWRVATRSQPIQDHFESGFPHDKSQFISASATCWGTMALALAEVNRRKQP